MKKPYLSGMLTSLLSVIFCVPGIQAAESAEKVKPVVKSVSRAIPKTASTENSKEHPLLPVLKWAKEGRPEIAEIKDYTALMMKQENINGEIQDAQVMDVKIRHKPFSVYLKFRYPENIAGQEVIYIEGQNDGNMLAHGVGVQGRFGTVKLDPNGPIAGRGNKYPITDIGMLTLIDRLVAVGEKDVKYGECEVKYYENIKDKDREYTMIHVEHPTPRKNFMFHIARILVDNELNVPVRYESYEWPTEKEEKPKLIEIYSYNNLKLNVGLTDEDFSVDNPNYGFKKK